MRFRLALLLTFALVVPASYAGNNVPDSAYRVDFAKWKASHESDLRKNWLTVVGLFWLKDGANRVGGDPHDEVALPAGKVPRQAGVIRFHDNKATFEATPGTKVMSDGKLVRTIELQPDVSGKPTVLDLGDVHFYVIQRGQKFGIRVKDMHSSFLAAFHGTQFYPLDNSYVVTGDFIPYGAPTKVKVPTKIGQDAEMDSPGEIEFTLHGQKLRLQALSEGTPELFIIFKDHTSGKTTYPPGRFLYAPLRKDGKVVLDFNRAYSPPCAWTPFATCPLPPKENRLDVMIEAGEKFSGHH